MDECLISSSLYQWFSVRIPRRYSIPTNIRMLRSAWNLRMTCWRTVGKERGTANIRLNQISICWLYSRVTIVGSNTCSVNKRSNPMDLLSYRWDDEENYTCLLRAYMFHQIDDLRQSKWHEVGTLACHSSCCCFSSIICHWSVSEKSLVPLY